MNRRIIKNIIKHKFFKSALFVLVLLASSYYYNYQEIISYRPTSVHQWRNSVSASMALNYAHEGDFFHPRTHNMQVDDYTSDVTISELPIIYYFVGMLYRIFGFHEAIYKVVNILICFTGLYFLFLLGLRIFKNTVYALFLPLILFSSPIYVYYTNNFIPDAPSLSIAMIGLYFFYLFYAEGKFRSFVFSMIFFCLAGLLKSPALLLFFAVSGLFVFERIFKISLHEEKMVFQKWPKTVLVLSGVMLLIIGWYAYAKIYTDLHGGVVSLVEIRPIWRLSSETIHDTWEAMSKRFWQGNYHAAIFLILVAVLFIHSLVFWKKYNRMLSILSVLSVLGGISFSLLFYRSMKQHDYYQMNNLAILVLVVLNFLLYVKNNHEKVFSSVFSKIALSIFMLFLMYSSNKLLKSEYYGGWFMEYSFEHYNNRYDHITPYLRSLGIEREDKVYCTWDPSINISLYLMDQKGHTDFFRQDESFQQKVALFREKGCKYVIIGDYDRIEIAPEMAGLLKIGEYREVGIYKFE